MLMAILHDKKGLTARGDSGPPKSIAEKYTGTDKDLPESKGKENHGGSWNKKNKLNKSEVNGVGVIVIDTSGRILIGISPEHGGAYALPGGGIDPGETAKEAAVRELEEEAGIKAEDIQELDSDDFGKVFLVKKWKNKIEDSRELIHLDFLPIEKIPWSYMRNCCVPGLARFISSQLKKSKRLRDLVQIEKLEKNIIRNSQVSGAVYDMTHGDALKLVGNAAYRVVRAGVKDMGDDEVKEVKFGSYTLVVRKHANDIYSGHVRDGHKTIHHFVNRSLPSTVADLMSVFEWYLPEDIPDLPVDNSVPDEIIEQGLGRMVHNYREHNLSDVYDEMENIREEIRHGNAVDLSKIEERIGKLIDTLDSKLEDMSEKHNSLARALGADIDAIEEKLKQLRSSTPIVESSSKITAILDQDKDMNLILRSFYEYLSRPSIAIEPNGRVNINFNNDWSNLDKTNFLQDLKAKVLKSSD
jgi:8-oxo-dGTP pyrophosphatase MutT (NUDIX family)